MQVRLLNSWTLVGLCATAVGFAGLFTPWLYVFGPQTSLTSPPPLVGALSAIQLATLNSYTYMGLLPAGVASGLAYALLPPYISAGHRRRWVRIALSAAAFLLTMIPNFFFGSVYSGQLVLDNSGVPLGDAFTPGPAPRLFALATTLYGLIMGGHVLRD